MAHTEATALLGYVGRQVQNVEEQLDIRWSRIGGTPVWSQQPSSSATVRQQDYFVCKLCQGRQVMLGQFSAGYGVMPQRLLHVFTCNGACGSDPQAWRILRSTGPTWDASTAQLQPESDTSGEVHDNTGGTGTDWSVPSSAPNYAGMDGDNWGLPSSNDWSNGVGGDWQISPSESTPIDAEIEALLQARNNGATASAAVPNKSNNDQDSAANEDSWVGVFGTSMVEAWPCLAVEIQCEPSEEPKSNDHEKELYEKYLQSEFAADDHCASDARGTVPAEFAKEISDEEAMMMADADAEADEFGSDDDEDDQINGDTAKWFIKFQRRLERSPTQVIRYAWDGSPLWMAPPPPEVNNGSWPPCCSRCGAPRMFELQLLPTLLSVVQTKSPNNTSASQMGWGTVVIYTCSQDCAADDPCEEFVVVQPAV